MDLRLHYQIEALQPRQGLSVKWCAATKHGSKRLFRIWLRFLLLDRRCGRCRYAAVSIERHWTAWTCGWWYFSKAITYVGGGSSFPANANVRYQPYHWTTTRLAATNTPDLPNVRPPHAGNSRNVDVQPRRRLEDQRSRIDGGNMQLTVILRSIVDDYQIDRSVLDLLALVAKDWCRRRRLSRMFNHELDHWFWLRSIILTCFSWRET